MSQSGWEEKEREGGMGQMSVSPAYPPPLTAAFSPKPQSLPLRIPEIPRGLITSRPPAVPPRATRTVLTWAAVPVLGEGEPA